MEALTLRLLLPPLVIALASLAQARLGDRLGGLVVGLPLTSGTFLALLHVSHGSAALAHSAGGMLAGQVAVVVMACAYGWCAPRLSPAPTLLAALAAWAVTVTLVAGSPRGVIVTTTAYAVVVGLALLRWPSPAAAPADPTPRRAATDLALRVTVGSGLVIALTAGVQLLGPSLAGTLAAAPLVALVLSPSTHRQRGAGAVRDLLGGVVRGSAGAAAFAVVVVALAGPIGGLSLLAAIAACLATVGLLGARPLVRRPARA